MGNNSIAILTYRRDASVKRLERLRELNAPQLIIDNELRLQRRINGELKKIIGDNPLMTALFGVSC